MLYMFRGCRTPADQTGRADGRCPGRASRSGDGRGNAWPPCSCQRAVCRLCVEGPRWSSRSHSSSLLVGSTCGPGPTARAPPGTHRRPSVIKSLKRLLAEGKQSTVYWKAQSSFEPKIGFQKQRKRYNNNNNKQKIVKSR